MCMNNFCVNGQARETICTCLQKRSTILFYSKGTFWPMIFLFHCPSPCHVPLVSSSSISQVAVWLTLASNWKCLFPSSSTKARYRAIRGKNGFPFQKKTLLDSRLDFSSSFGHRNLFGKYFISLGWGMNRNRLWQYATVTFRVPNCVSGAVCGYNWKPSVVVWDVRRKRTRC